MTSDTPKNERRQRREAIERELWPLTRRQLLDHPDMHINTRMGDYRNSWDKGTLVRHLARILAGKTEAL